MYYLIPGIFEQLDPGDPRFAAYLFVFILCIPALLGGKLLTAYIAPGILAYERNHPRKAGIMWDVIRFGWLSAERARLTMEAAFGTAPGYDSALPDKVAESVAREVRRSRREG